MSRYLRRVSDIYQDDEQSEAFSRESSCVVIAGPGSGKTALLTAKVAQLILEKRVQFPHKIACLTFSRTLAKDLAQELHQLGVYDREILFVGTIHKFCVSEIIMPASHILGDRLPNPFRIGSNDEVRRSLIKALGQQVASVAIRGLGSLHGDLDRYRKKYWFSGETEFPEVDSGVERTWPDLNWRQLATDYQQYLLEGGEDARPAIDFVSVELLAQEIIQSSKTIRDVIEAKYPWWAIDEYQDLGGPFHRMITHLLDETDVNVIAIGDPDQCIYEKMHGSNPLFVRELGEQIFRKTQSPYIHLKQNYRSVQRIIALGDLMLGKNTGYHSRQTDRGGCYVIYASRASDIFDVVERLINLPENWREKSSVNNQRSTVVLHHRRNKDVEGGAPNLRSLLYRLENSKIERDWAVKIDKDPQYGHTFEAVAWIEMLAKWCKGEQIFFHEVLPYWIYLCQLDGTVFSENDVLNAEQTLFSTLDVFRSYDCLLPDWLDVLHRELDLTSKFELLAVERPDDVAEYRRFFKSAHNQKRLSICTLVEFAKLGYRIELATLYSSKGLQYDRVIILGLDEMSESQEQISDLDRRLAYVGVTRAKNEVYIIIHESQSKYGQELIADTTSDLQHFQAVRRKDGWTLRKRT